MIQNIKQIIIRIIIKYFKYIFKYLLIVKEYQIINRQKILNFLLKSDTGKFNWKKNF